MHASNSAALMIAVLAAATVATYSEEPVSVIKLIRDSETMLVATNHPAARELARRAVELDPAHAPAWLQLGTVEFRDRQYEEATKAFRESLTVDPTQTSIWKFVSLAEWNAGRNEEAIVSLRAYLEKNPSDAGASHDLASWLAALGEQKEATEILARLLRSEGADPRLWKELGIMHFRQGNYESARDAYEEALKHSPDDAAIHRDLAWCYWNMHQKSEARPLLEKALSSILVYLKSDPGNVPLNVMAGRILSALDQKDQAREHHTALLARNTNFVPSLTYLREDAAARGDAATAATLARRRSRIEPSNLDARLDLASSLAQHDDFASALKMLRDLAATPPESARLILAYQTMNEFDGPGRNTIDQVLRHIDILAEAGYQLDNRFSEPLSDAKPVAILIIQEAGVNDLRAIDERLEKRGGRAIYTGHLAGRPSRRSVKPTAEFLISLQESSRWLILPALSLDRQMVDERGTLGNPLTHALYLDGQRESDQERSTRLTELLSGVVDSRFANPERIFIYPFGDFGQRSLDANGEDLTALRTAVREIADHCIYFADQGHHIMTGDSLTIPALEVSPLATDEVFQKLLTSANPLVAARLELAKVLYWNRQYEQAHHWFDRAEDAGADPFSLYFSWGACADNQGDIPTALEKIAKARSIDPDDERLIELTRRAEDRLNSTLDLSARRWEDNEDRTFTQRGAEARAFAGNSLQIGLMANHNRWAQKSKGSEEGIRAGLAGKAFLAPQVWLDANIWHLDMDDVDDLTGGEAMLHLPFRWTSGYVELSGSRDEIETVESLRAGIYADMYRIHNYSRIADRYDLFASVMSQQRSDENDTLSAEGRLLYRVREWPYVGLGYHVRLGDSDRDPPEYWAPEELEQHQAHLNIRRTAGRSRLTLSGDAGYARERAADWRFVWGANGTIEITLYRHLSLRLQGQYHESPTYERASGTLGLGLEF